MAAMAIGACRSRQIMPLVEGRCVTALPIERQLIGAVQVPHQPVQDWQQGCFLLGNVAGIFQVRLGGHERVS